MQTFKPTYEKVMSAKIHRMQELQTEIDQLDNLMRDNILSDDNKQHGIWYIQKCDLEKALATIIRGL